MRKNVYHPSWILLTSLGAVCFWSALSHVLRPPEPHPGLRDEALKSALRSDHDHHPLSYYEARKHLFGSVDGDGRTAHCVYTDAKLEYFKQPLPNDALIEHAWPVHRLPSDARSDLHHMFAVDAEARVARSILRYGKVVFPVWSEGGSRSGPSARLKPVFEVRPERRGDVARAMFYVSTMYDVEIGSEEESVLRRWHAEDRVDEQERKRNDRVAKRQRSRNPFVDHPALTARIANF